MDRSSRQRINKEIADCNTIDQKDLTDIYRAFYLTTAKCIFLSSTHGTFSRADYMLDHKTSLSKFKKIEIIPSVFFDHHGM